MTTRQPGLDTPRVKQLRVRSMRLGSGQTRYNEVLYEMDPYDERRYLWRINEVARSNPYR
jgi:hypothetical protein